MPDIRTAKTPEVRDEAWVAERFGDVGPPPSNEVIADPAAAAAPNVGHPKGDDVNG